MRLEQAMPALQERFDITSADLSLDVGPLGSLLGQKCLQQEPVLDDAALMGVTRSPCRYGRRWAPEEQ